ncbi:MAG TPA: glucodextranase DOMON-like domain-containing protein [Acidobacteriota bacterium]|nr:glucodextranase DOMON-like domain-containing protein [Acidobacteriota bacterium]
MRVLILLAILLMLLDYSHAAEKIFTLKDPAGDDYGDGTILYPLRDDMKKGDLDLVSLSARQEDDGTLFEAVFANNIVAPDWRAIDAGGMPLNRVMRLGFYTFNVDIYIDKDGIKGSGEVRTLPGRRAVVNPESAWEKVICLTPRPADAETVLDKIVERREYDSWKEEKGRVDPEDEIEIKGRAKQSLRDRYFFPTRVRVRGKTVEFFVPSSFLGGKADPSWNYIVAVTAATKEERIDLVGLFNKESKEDPPLMNLQVIPGRPQDNLGTTQRDKEALQTAIVDLIVPDGQKQSEILRDYNINTGKPVSLPGVKPH